MFEKQQAFDKVTRDRIGFEYMALFLHITSRTAISILGEDKAWKLMETQTLIFKDHMMRKMKNSNKDNREELDYIFSFGLTKGTLSMVSINTFQKKIKDLRIPREVPDISRTAH